MYNFIEENVALNLDETLQKGGARSYNARRTQYHPPLPPPPNPGLIFMSEENFQLQLFCGCL